MITQCSFGSMAIDGEKFGSDLKIFPDGRVEDNWWRNFGHRLNPNDITDIVESRPEVIVVGTGIYGRMEIARETQAMLSQEGITLVTDITEKAAELFNVAVKDKKNVAGCFHLTC